MYLKGLKIQGFKSFADKISLDFSNGITAIVGPNGSGKSNISDAVRWVLGEQSAKSLRGSKMEDIIFNGTQTRSPLGFAEVTLTLDNKDKTFHIDFDEVAITRKVYASGESQYMINKTPCRLKDIHEVFMDTGIGRDGYSIIGQGKIEEILSTKSEDRRQIFEEAAGISKYRYRKEEAERKLKHADENLSRILDIILELENQLEPLQRQSEKAKKFLLLKEELKVYEVNVAILLIDANKKLMAELEETFQNVTRQLNGVKLAMEKAEKEQEQYYTLTKEQEETVRGCEQTLRETEAKVGILKGEIEVLRNTISGNQQLMERIEAENRELHTKISGVQAEIAQVEENRKQLGQQKEVIDRKIAEDTQKSNEIMSGAGQQNDAISGMKNEVIELLNRMSEYKITLSNSDVMMQNFRERKDKVEEELKGKTQGLEGVQDKQVQLEKDHSRKSDLIATIEKRLEEERLQESSLTADIEVNKQQLTQINIAIHDKKNRAKLLRGMEQNFEGYYKSVKEIMKSHRDGQLKFAKIYGPVSKLLKVQEKYGVAIEVALGGALQNIVVEDENDAKVAIRFLKEIKGGRATFMPISAVKGTQMTDKDLRNEKGFVGIAAEVVDCEEKYRGIVNNLLGKVVLVDNVENGIILSRKFKNSFRIVSLDGEAFHVGGSMAGGSLNRHGNIMGREQEIQKLEKEVNYFNRQYQQIEDGLKKDEESLSKIKTDIAKSNLVLNENKEILLVLNQEMTHLKSLIQETEGQKGKLEQENQQMEANLRRTKQEALDCKDILAEMEQQVESKRNEINALEQEFEDIMNQRQQLSDFIVEKTIARSAVVKDIEVTEAKLAELQLNLSQHENHILLRNIETADIEKKNTQLQQEIEEKSHQMTEASAKVLQLGEQIKELLEKKQNFDQKSLEAQARAKELREDVYSLTGEYNRLETKQVKLETELENTINRLWDEYELTHSQALDYQAEIGSAVHANKKIAHLRGKIRELGNVNVDAIEEYKTVKERYDFLTAQKEDLIQSKENLNEIIAEMLLVMRKQFAEAFNQINAHFKSTFSELFGGGKASLSLTDPNNILECGINIDVQPPGKKLQSLTLLSGGERALSAIALLFAILKSRPTPFCFLDEIEAALDDVNVYRFSDYLKGYSQNTQFIIVTHRRGTMESADVIYGVTMQEKGVSKLLELNINEIAG